ncbi:AsmA-like protein [Gramella sp. Hel_I_59]|uniref:AsmA-like C-terminal region-containing protein n=1 Tax=Gramella sp. Hel_I_59 TaxID=1249978 RepID=UPI00115233A1|nr:AsmA-like C-terminal region-containing protein [Gramella sp. Hel_I_59]TQI71411.1 AsmA-like protein [Gramella sp. Hel_I_59]
MDNTSKKKKRKKPNWIKRILIALGLLFLAPLFLFTLGWFSRDLLIDELQIWYEANSNGTLEIGEVNANFITGFPNVGFSIEDVKQSSFDTILDKRTIIKLARADVNIAAKDLMRGNIQFRNIKIRDASVHTQVLTEKNLQEYIELKLKKQLEQNSGFDLPSWVHPDKTNFQLQNVHFIAENKILHKYFDLVAENVSGQIRSGDEIISGNITYEVFINDLGFNTRKGSFINGALATGSPEFELKKSSNTLSLPAFELQLDDQYFEAEAQFVFNKLTEYEFSLKNEVTDFKKIQQFLADSLAAKVKPYQLQDPIATNLKLKGKFAYGDVPFIHVDFSTNNNKLQLFEELELENVESHGILTNNLNSTDSLAEQPGKRDIKLYFKDFSANLEDIQVSAQESYYQSTANLRNQVKANIQVNGSNETMARALDHENFSFEGGQFSLDATIDGNIDDPYMILNAAKGTFTMGNTRVALKENNVQLPLRRLDLKLDNNNSILRQLQIDLPNGESLNFRGNVKNVSALMASNPSNPAEASLILNSDALNLDDLINTATKFTSENKGDQDNLKTLHQTLATIYKKFQPGFQLNINSVIYQDNLFQNLKARVHLKNSEVIQFDQLQFDYQDAETLLSGSVWVPKVKENNREPIFINVTADSKGSIRVFQDLFNIKLVSLRKGDFAFQGKFTGNVQYFDQLLRNAEGDLQLSGTEFYYPEAEMKFAMDTLHVGIEKSDIQIDRFALETIGHHPIYLQSKITDFASFLLEKDTDTGSIAVKLDANYIDVDQWLESIAEMERDSLKDINKNTHVSNIFQDIYKFHPKVQVELDSVKFNDLISEGLKAFVNFENDSILKLDDLNLKFKETRANIQGSITAKEPVINTENENPFDFQFSLAMNGKSKDLNELLNTVNFELNSGDFEFTGSYQGQAQDLSILNSNAEGDLKLGATLVRINETDLEIPVDSLHLIIKNDLATLDRLDVDLPGKSSIDITGTIDHFSNFINNEQLELAHTSNFMIRSPYLDSKDIAEFIGSDSSKRKKKTKSEFKVTNLKEILRNINDSYFPTASVALDSVILEGLGVSDFNAKLSFDPEGNFKLNNTNFSYQQGSIEVELLASVDSSEVLPVHLMTEINAVDIQKLIADLDYLNMEELSSAEKIAGKLNLKIDARTKLLSNGNIDINSLNGSIVFDLQDLELYDFKPVLESVVLMKEERFEKLRFRPITQTFRIENGVVIVPRTQIQSSALQLYAEGEFKLDEYFDIWLSLPWKNLKSNDGLQLPEKETYKEAGAKFYLQLIQNKESDEEKERKLRTRFRLWNRELKNKTSSDN